MSLILSVEMQKTNRHSVLLATVVDMAAPETGVTREMPGGAVLHVSYA